MRGAEGGNEADGPCSAAAAAREALALGGSPGDRPVLRGARAPVAVEIAGAEEERSGAVVASGARRDGADGVHVDRARRRLDAATVGVSSTVTARSCHGVGGPVGMCSAASMIRAATA